MKQHDQSPELVQDVCKRLKGQLDELSSAPEVEEADKEQEIHRLKTLFQVLQQKLSELSG